MALKATKVGRAWWLLAIGVALGGCEPGANLPPTQDAKVDAYHLGPGDVVRVSTFGEQALTGEFRVSDSGSIAVPLLGPVRAQGLTLAALSDEIGRALVARNLFRDPNVSTEVVSYRSVYILGEVARPGKYPYEPGMTVLTAVAVAGGFTYRAIEDSASVIRIAGSVATETRAQRQTLIQPGDVVTIFERTY